MNYEGPEFILIILVPIASPPPRRLDVARRYPSSLREFATGATPQGLVIPVEVNQNGGVHVGATQSINMNNLAGVNVGNMIQNAMGTIGEQIQQNIANIGGNLTGNFAEMVQTAAQNAAAQHLTQHNAATNVRNTSTPNPAQPTGQNLPRVGSSNMTPQGKI